MAIAAAPIHRLTVEQVDTLVEYDTLEERRMGFIEGILFDVVLPTRRTSRPWRSSHGTCTAI